MARMNAEHRKRMIRTNAALLAAEIGLAELTFENVAEKCPVRTSASTVRRYFRLIGDLRLAAVDADVKLRPQAVAMGLIDA